MKQTDKLQVAMFIKRSENYLDPRLAGFSGGVMPLGGPLAHGWFGSNRLSQGLREQGRSTLEGVGGAALGNVAGRGLGDVLQKIPYSRISEHIPIPGLASKVHNMTVGLNPARIRSGLLAALLGITGGLAGSMHGAAASARNFNERNKSLLQRVTGS